MDLRVPLSNTYPHLCRLDAELASIRVQEPPGRPASSTRSRPQRRKPLRRLSPAERDELAAAYRAGQTVYQLAEAYGINRHTVAKHLRAVGVRMRLDGLTNEQLDQAVVLYESGWSLARIADRFGVTAKTVHTRLRGRGIRMRDSHGRPR